MTEKNEQAQGSGLSATVRPRDERLEALSDKVRKGEPIDFIEALEVIAYQEDRKQRLQHKSLWARLRRWFRAA